jgi:oligopeptide transport system substrate-binding protein
MRFLRWRVILPLLLLTLVVGAACGDDDDDDDDVTAGQTATPAATGTATAVATPTGEPAEPQIFRSRLQGEPGTLDPQRATDTDSISVLRQIYSTLLILDQDQQLQPDVAAEIPTVANGGISADGLTYTFKLKDDLKWSDGTPLVAQAFVDGAKRLFEPGSANFYVDFYRVLAAGGTNAELEQALADGVEGDALAALEQAVADNLEVSAPDDKTVVYQLNSQSPVFLLLATMWPLYPVRQDIIDANGDQWTEAGTLVANGMFSLADWNHSESLRLVKNDNWHRESFLDEVEIDIIADDAVAFLAYKEGELDATTLGPAELVQVRGTDLEDEFRTYARLSTIGIYFNFRTDSLQEAGVRQALASAIDRDEYAEIVREGAVGPAYGWVPPGMPGFDPEVGRQYETDVANAQKLLADAGYPGGEGLELEILSADSTVGVLTVEWLKEQWETNLGATVTINTLDRSGYFAERNAGNYQVTTGGWGADYPDPQNWMPLFRSGGGLNSGDYSNIAFDDLIVAADTELDNDKRIGLYLDAQRIMLDDVPFAPLYHGRRNILVKPWVQGFLPSSMESNQPGDFFFDTIFIEGRS